MKTRTYLRFSLLIPFIVWGICVLIFFILTKVAPVNDPAIDVAGYLIAFLMFYTLGIIIWLVPYILLALILFFWSFIAQVRSALKVFALAPLGMTLLTIATLDIITLGFFGNDPAISKPGLIDMDFIGSNLLSAGSALVWGYICVGIGFGVYKLLQRQRLIRDEDPAPITEPVQASV
jgi:hypothetical protein